MYVCTYPSKFTRNHNLSQYFVLAASDERVRERNKGKDV